jgi:hypothetical protein
MKYISAVFFGVAFLAGCDDGSDHHAAQSEQVSPCPGGIMDLGLLTEIQISAEETAQAIYDSPSLQAQILDSRDLMLAYPSGMQDDNAADALLYARELGYNLSLRRARHDPYRPEIIWGSWLGARGGLDNPDTIYRGVAVSADGRYAVSGQRNQSAGLFFQLMNVWPGTDGTQGSTLNILDNDALVVAEDGSFTITLDADPANGRSNHIQLPPESHSLLIRDTLTDWCQLPASMDIELLNGNDLSIPPAASQAQLEQEASANFAAATRTWLDFSSRLKALPANLLTPAIQTAGGLPGQYSSYGNFFLASDEAIVVTVNPAGADYFGFQLGSDFFASFEYRDHTSSLSADQARPNADGTITYVIARRDPGVWNWLDPVEHEQGLVFIRWQGAPAQPVDVPLVEVLALADLASALPADMVMVSAEEREAQISQRHERADLRRDHDDQSRGAL